MTYSDRDDDDDRDDVGRDDDDGSDDDDRDDSISPVSSRIRRRLLLSGNPIGSKSAGQYPAAS